MLRFMSFFFPLRELRGQVPETARMEDLSEISQCRIASWNDSLVFATRRRLLN
jgi:hypothetical protein